MPGYLCKKCGAHGSSKNIQTRTFFPDNEKAAMVSHMLTIDPDEPKTSEGVKLKNFGEVHVTVHVDGLEEMSRSDQYEALGKEFVQFVKNWASDGDYGIDTITGKPRPTPLASLTEWSCEHKYEAQGPVEC